MSASNIPRFVSQFLDELPPVTFSNMDVSSLLGRREQLYTEFCSLKHSMQLQADVGDDFLAIADCALERPADQTPGGGIGASAAMDGGTVCEDWHQRF